VRHVGGQVERKAHPQLAQGTEKASWGAFVFFFFSFPPHFPFSSLLLLLKQLGGLQITLQSAAPSVRKSRYGQQSGGLD